MSPAKLPRRKYPHISITPRPGDVKVSIVNSVEEQEVAENYELRQVENRIMFEIKNPILILADLKESDKGREVVYTDYNERGKTYPSRSQRGIISSWNDKFIFVRFNILTYSGFPTLDYQSTGQACNPEYLHFLVESKGWGYTVTPA